MPSRMMHYKQGGLVLTQGLSFFYLDYSGDKVRNLYEVCCYPDKKAPVQNKSLHWRPCELIIICSLNEQMSIQQL